MTLLVDVGKPNPSFQEIQKEFQLIKFLIRQQNMRLGHIEKHTQYLSQLKLLGSNAKDPILVESFEDYMLFQFCFGCFFCLFSYCICHLVLNIVAQQTKHVGQIFRHIRPCVKDLRLSNFEWLAMCFGGQQIWFPFWAGGGHRTSFIDVTCICK